MRTTIDIDDNVLAAARAIASTERRSLGSVISELASRGLRPRTRSARDRIPTFDIPDDAAPLTPELVDRALDE